MKIGIDARLYGLKHTGIGRYVMELISSLSKINSGHQFTVFTHPDNHSKISQSKNFKVIPVNIRHYSLKEQLLFPGIIDRQKLDLVHIPHFNVPISLQTPYVVTIHDLLWHQILGYNVTTLNPLVYSFKYLGYRLVIKRAATKACHIITPSQWVKNHLLKTFSSLKPDQVSAIYEGIGSSFSPQKPLLVGYPRSLSIDTPYLVYTGSLYPHKNVKTLIKALKKINHKSDTKFTLIIVSARSQFTHKLRQLAYKLDQEHFIKFAGFLKDKDLANLYQHALALVHPSTSEGFGLTGLEAMASGLPVISSNSSSLPEVYGNAALFFNPRNSRDLSQKILRLFKDKKLQRSLKNSGFKQAKKYSWQKMAKQTLEIYQTCA